MTEKRIAQQWTISIHGVERMSVKLGSSVEIGRKPIRPLADDGFMRLDVVDETRSMSKRHAVFSLSDTGTAFLRDLNSTNGTYVVRSNGELMRLQAGENFLLPTSPMRIQLGDVPVDFTRVDLPQEAETHAEVPDLFKYAAADVKQEPDVADMSVDDILDLRAGEPTSIFNANTVANRVHELKSQADQLSVNILQPGHRVEQEPRDLFVDALQDASQDDGINNGEAEMSDAVKQVEAAQQAEGLESIDEVVGVDAVVPMNKMISENSFGGTALDESDEPVQAAQPVEVQDSAGTENMKNSAQPLQSPEISQIASPAQNNQPAGPVETVETAEVEGHDSHNQGETIPVETVFGKNNTGITFTAFGSEHGEHGQQLENAEANVIQPQSNSREFALDETSTFKPAFEPGSVFERVSKGDFETQPKVIEVEGLTSEEAKRTGDFTIQFEMARHAQLLPFLAMNPSLYDDLYAWLAAQGDSDIDAALSHNTGYEEYRKAVGK